MRRASKRFWLKRSDPEGAGVEAAAPRTLARSIALRQLRSSERPSAFARISPFGASFSMATSRVSAAIHNKFITPPTNSKAISAQQQPRQ